MGILNSVSSAVRKRFLDVFSSRSDTTGSLGTATDGSDWTAVNGTIEVKTGAAKATTIPSTSGSTYPIAIQDMPTSDNIIKISGTNEGSAAAIWVQSSSDWWMVNVEGTQTTNTNYAGATAYSYNYVYTYAYNFVSTPAYNYNYYQRYYNPTYTTTTALGTVYYVTTSGGTSYYVTTVSGTPYTVSYSTGSTTAYYKTGYKYYSVKNTNYTSGAPYTSGATTYYILPPGTYQSGIGYTSSSYQGVNTWWASGAPYNSGDVLLLGYQPGSTYSTTDTVAAFVTAGNYYTYIAGYSTSYNEYLKIKQSVANTVSEISSALVSTTQTIGSILVSLVGNQITAKAYSDTNFVTQIGSDLVYTATGATITTKHGIGVSPSAYNQSAIIGTSVDISRN